MPQPESRYAATVVIATKNRRDDLRKAVASCIAQVPPVETIVIDDGSTDGTSEMLRAEFPQVRIVGDGTSRGYIVRRNEGAELASAPVIFSIDDDAEFSAPDVVARTLACFNDERVAAIAIPFIDVNHGPQIKQQPPTADESWASSYFIGTAHAIRRELFRSMGGYRQELIHQGEEIDLCMRLLEAGYYVRLGDSAPINHYESPVRSWARIRRFDQRNRILIVWWNVPWPYLAYHLPITIFLGLISGLRNRLFKARVLGTLDGLRAMPRTWRNRRAMRPNRYRLFRRLRKQGPLRAAEVRELLR